MYEDPDFQDAWNREVDERIWRERRDEIQRRVTPEDFAIFLHKLEQIEARVIGQGLCGENDEDDDFIFCLMRSVYFIGYMNGLRATAIK